MSQEPMDAHIADRARVAELLARHDRPGPRYTSYPTAVEFGDGVDRAVYAERLAAANARADEPLSVYMHLPFCEERCLFCGCHVIISPHKEKAAPYVDLLMAEVDLIADHLPDRRTISQLHLGGGTPTIVPTEHSSGRRLAFARWLTDPAHPRTARVMANRLWQHHFGQGLVETPNDFGRLGSSPSHPELLDWLAHELVEREWSLKAMHRLIVTSHAYRQSSAPVEKALIADPNNRLLWRFSPRRLTAEEIRDSILAVNGTLNRKLGGPGVYPPMPKEILATSSRPGSAWGRSSPEDAARRSVYIHVKRSLLSPLLVGFDLADTDTTCPVRFATTQPTQALTLLNSEFSQRQAAHFADRLETERPGDRRAQVIRGLELARQRPADFALVDRQLAFLDELTSKEGLPPRRALELFALVLINLNEFLYVD